MARSLPPDDAYIVIDESLATGVMGVRAVPFSLWQANNRDALESPLPIGVAVTRSVLDEAPTRLIQALEAAHVPVEICDDMLEAETVIRWLTTSLDSAMQNLHVARRGNAALRRSQDELQRSFVDAEAWLHMMLAPKFVCEREIVPSAATVMLAKGEALVQLLPVSSYGLIAVDLWIDAAEELPVVELATAQNELIGSLTAIPHSRPAGNLRYVVERGIAGEPKDVVLRVRNVARSSISIRLGENTAQTTFRASHANSICAAPMAMRIWKGLPGVRGPEIQSAQKGSAAKTRFVMPAEIVSLKTLRGRCENHDSLGAIEMRPDRDGRAILVIEGVSAAPCKEIFAYVQLFGDDGAAFTICATPPGAIVSADQAYRLPVGRFVPATQYTHLGCAVNEPEFDLVLRLEQAKPGAALWIWALKLVLD